MVIQKAIKIKLLLSVQFFTEDSTNSSKFKNNYSENFKSLLDDSLVLEKHLSKFFFTSVIWINVVGKKSWSSNKIPSPNAKSSQKSKSEISLTPYPNNYFFIFK